MHPYAVSPGEDSFVDSFEAGLRYWEMGGANNIWGLTAQQSATGNLSIADSPTTQYRDNTDSYLKSDFRLDLSQVAGAALAFEIKCALLAPSDSLCIEASADGAIWIPLGAAITGSIPAFSQLNYVLDPMLGQSDVRFRFRLMTDGVGRDDGVYIDNVSVEIIFTPELSYSPAAVYDTIYQDENISWNIYISNRGLGDLIFGCEYDPTFMSVEPDTGIVLPSGVDSLLATFSSLGLPVGDWNADITIGSNDPDEGEVTIPGLVTILFDDRIPCEYYLIGDINSNMDVNGVDVIYGVSYFKGGPAPPYECTCPPGNTISWHVTGDVNANCQFNGIDITFFVAYLKGLQPALLPCPDCPPARRL